MVSLFRLTLEMKDYMVLVHSLLIITTPFALFSTHATSREIVYSLEKSKATHMFVHASILDRFLPVAREFGFPEDHIYILEGETEASPKLPSFEQLVQKVRSNKIPREPVREAGKDTLAYLVFSSGTSGLPKGIVEWIPLYLYTFPQFLWTSAVMISHGNLVFSLMQGVVMIQESAKIADVRYNIFLLRPVMLISTILQPPPDATTQIPVILSFLPMFHSYSLHYTCLRSARRSSPTHPLLSIMFTFQTAHTAGHSCYFSAVEPQSRS